MFEQGRKRRTEAARRLRQISAALERTHLQTSALAISLRERIITSPLLTAHPPRALR
ncbi:hypothetical protein [Nocardia uniformis]|uniref:hypothetical protein n=1 Tax=Nocardia uniformis TaxID=53432 RepID=UPI000AA90562|nr:hypothetical protein [Nocardia uniformis]